MCVFIALAGGHIHQLSALGCIQSCGVDRPRLSFLSFNALLTYYFSFYDQASAPIRPTPLCKVFYWRALSSPALVDCSPRSSYVCRLNYMYHPSSVKRRLASGIKTRMLWRCPYGFTSQHAVGVASPTTDLCEHSPESKTHRPVSSFATKTKVEFLKPALLTFRRRII